MTLRKLISLGEEFDYLRTMHACFKASSAKLLGNPCPLDGAHALVAGILLAKAVQLRVGAKPDCGTLQGG